MKNINRNIYIDCIRGASALMIVLYHYTTRYEQLFQHTVSWPITFPFGCYAVGIFFLLSGYFGVKNIEKITPVKYLIKRCFRLFPVYWVSIVIVMLVTTFLLPSRAVSIKEMLVNFTMLQGYFGVANVDGVFWTLKFEIYFYFLIFIIAILRLQKHVDKLCVLWVLLQIFSLVLPNKFLGFYIKKINRLFLMGNSYGPTFITGAIVASLEARKNSRKIFMWYEKCLSWLLYLSVCVCIILFFTMNGMTNGIIFLIGTCFLAIAIYVNDNRRDVAAINKLFYLLPWIASISYPLYLIHQNIGYVIIMFLEKNGFTNEVFIIVPLALMMGIAYILHKFVEIPMSIQGNKICDRLL